MFDCGFTGKSIEATGPLDICLTHSNDRYERIMVHQSAVSRGMHHHVWGVDTPDNDPCRTLGTAGTNNDRF
jgi:hypothetical protein